MSDHVAISEYLGVDEHLLYTSDERAIALFGEDLERPFGRLFVQADGRVVLRTGNFYAEPGDFPVKVRGTRN